MKYISIFFILFLGISYAQVNQLDAKGLKQGLWYKNFPGTKIHMYEGTFKDDKPVGIFKYHYESGRLSLPFSLGVWAPIGQCLKNC